MQDHFRFYAVSVSKGLVSKTSLFLEFRESQESFAYEDNPTDEHFAGSPSEDGQVEWKRRVIKAVDEGGESMISMYPFLIRLFI